MSIGGPTSAVEPDEQAEPVVKNTQRHNPMYQIPVWLTGIFGILLVVAGVSRYRQRRARTRGEPVVVDDLAVAEIIDRGVLTTPEDEPLDEEEIRRAEEEFWEQSWEEPERYGG